VSWGENLLNVSDDKRLLYWALMFAISPREHRPLDYFLSKILKTAGHAGGDPGWEIENLTTPDGQVEFYVWVDPDLLPMEQHEGKYPENTFQMAVKNALLEYLVAYPEKKGEVNMVLARYKL
jgi:hypothetical protein